MKYKECNQEKGSFQPYFDKDGNLEMDICAECVDKKQKEGGGR